MTTRFIFPMKVLGWAALQTEQGQPISPGNKMNAVGFIPVYTSVQAMVKVGHVQMARG